jgi:OFA family oxalate/formate antiporter-like MFS transporter
MKEKSRTRAWTVLWAAAGLNFLTGILYIWSILSKALLTDSHWSSKEASLPYTMATISFVVFMMIFGRLQDAKGPRFTATFSATLMGVGLILSGFATNPLLMLISFGVFTGAGIGIGSISTMPPAVKWFPPEKKGFVTGIVVAGVGASSIFFAPVTNVLLNAVGVSRSFIINGVAVLVSGLIFASLLRNPPAGYIAPSQSRTEKKQQTPVGFAKDLTTKEMLKTANFYKLWLMLAFSSSAGLMMIGHAANIARIQVNWEGGYLLVALLAIFNALGRFLGGAVSDRIGRINLMRIIFSLQAINMLLFGSYQNVALLAVGVSLAGLNYGATFSVYPATVVDFYGVKNVGANYSILFTGWGVAGVIGPMTAAAIFDATQSYNPAYLVAFGLLVISILITFTFSRKSIELNTKMQEKNV